MAKNLTGYVRFDKRRKRWFFRCAPADPKTGLRREHKEFFLTQREAEQARRKFLSKYEQTGESVFIREELTFEQLAQRYKETRLIPVEYIDGKKVAGHRELSSLYSCLKSLTEYFRKRKMRSIHHSDIETLKLHLIRKPTRAQKQRAAATVNRELEFLRAMMNFAFANGWIDRSPFQSAYGKKLIIKSIEKRRERFPTFGEELAMLQHCTGRIKHLAPLIIIAADTGLRRREILTLQVADLDFAQRVIRLQPQNAKTNLAREVPMTQRVLEQLQALSKELDSHQLIFGGLGEFKHAFTTLRTNTNLKELHFHEGCQKECVSAD